MQLMPSNPICAAVVSLLLFLAAGKPASPQSAFEWPDAQKNGIVLVNTNQYIPTYIRNHPDWFTDGEPVLDLSVAIRPDGDQAEWDRNQIRDLLRSKGMAAGTYTSGTTVVPLAEIKLWPYDKAPIEWMPKAFKDAGSWPNEPDRKVIDVTDAQTRRALQEAIRRIWEKSPAPLRFVDNAASHSSTGGTQPWQAYCDNMREIRLLGERMGSRLVFNVALNLAMLSDVEASQLIEAVGRNNGILLEDPWSDATRKSPGLTSKAKARYRQLLDRQITIIMAPVSTPVDALLDWVATWRQPSDRLYLGWSFWKQPWDGKRPWQGTTPENPQH